MRSFLNFAVFSEDKIYRAESAEGTRIRISTVENNPEGDADFWQQALVYHLESYYKKAEKIQEGSIKAVLFTSKESESYHFLVGIFIKDKTVFIVEVFFPDTASLNLRLNSIKASLKDFKVQ